GDVARQKVARNARARNHVERHNGGESAGAGGELHADDDRQTDSAFACTRGRHDPRRDLDRRFGEVGYRHSVRRDPAPGDVYLRRLHRLVPPSNRNRNRNRAPARARSAADSITITSRSTSAKRQKRYNFQTVFPPTIVRAARPFSFQPWNGVLRDIDWKFCASTVHSRSGSIRVMSAARSMESVPASI